MDLVPKQPIVEGIPTGIIGRVDKKLVVKMTWSWKLVTIIDDAISFLNGAAPSRLR